MQQLQVKIMLQKYIEIDFQFHLTILKCTGVLF